MPNPASHLYAFDSFLVDPLKRILLLDDKPVHLTPKAFDILITLLENKGRPIDKEALMNSVWPDTVVEENNLTRNISSLRKALGERPDDHRYVVTIPGHGYSFVANVQLMPLQPSEVIVSRHVKSRIVIQDDAVPNTDGSTIVGRSLLSGIFGRYQGIMLIAAFIVFASISAAALWYNGFFARGSEDGGAIAPFQKMKPSKLTNVGNVVAAAVSSDGEYVAYAVDEGGPQSLWLRRASSEGNTRIVEAADVDYWGLTFTRENDFLYYTSWERNKTDAALYRVPALGGVPPQRILNNVGSRISFSPDGRQFAYSNDFTSKGYGLLATATSDGANERRIFTSKHPDFFTTRPHTGPSWSPDGLSIASAYGAIGSRGLVQVNVDDGTMRPLTSHTWQDVGQVEWLSNGKGMVVVARDSESSTNQMWLVSYPDGVVTRITNDLFDYRGVNVSPHSNMLVTVQHDTRRSLWLFPDGDSASAKQLGNQTVGEFFSWTQENGLIYTSNISGKSELWKMDGDGTGAKQFSSDGKVGGYVSASRDGRYIVVSSNRSGKFHIWRLNNDGSGPIQLTNGEGEYYSHLSPDGNWVVYRHGYGWVKSTVWKVPIDGGDPVQLTEEMSLQPNVSPGGNLIAYFYMDSNDWGLAVMPFDGGMPLKRFTIPKSVGSRVVRWTPDGTALAYINDANGVSNIWSQPIEGGSPKQLTSFESERIFYFDWSFDGKSIACTRGHATDDVVIIRDFY